MKSLRKILFATAISLSIAGPAAAAWPDRPITIVVPFSPGGSTDMTARVLADRLTGHLGVAVVVENKGGAGGNIGAAHVARAAPDGYTYLLATSTHVTNVSLYKDLQYDVLTDLTPVSQVAFIPNMLVVNKDVPVNTLPEFLSYVQEKKGPVNYGSSGVGASQHIAGELFNNMAKGDMTHIPYKGGGAVLSGLLAGDIQAYYAPLAEVVSYIEGGQVKGIGVTTKERSERFPDIQAIDEVLPGYHLALWNGILAPAKTPPEIVNKMSEALRAILKDPKVLEALETAGSTPVGSTPEEFRAFMESEVPTWARLVEISGAAIN